MGYYYGPLVNSEFCNQKQPEKTYREGIMADIVEQFS